MSRSEIISAVIQSGGRMKLHDIASIFGGKVVDQEVRRGKPLETSTDSSGTQWIEVHLDGLKLCKRHCSSSNCDDIDCRDLHLCKFYILSKCTYDSKKCEYGHDVTLAHNQKILERHGLADLSHSTLQSLFKNNRTEVTLPLTCKYYNKKGGCSKPTSGKDECPFLHVCDFFLQGRCRPRGSEKCERSHNLVTDEHTRRILEKFGIVASTNEDILNSFQGNRIDRSSGQQGTGKVTSDGRQRRLEPNLENSAGRASSSSPSSSSVMSLKKPSEIRTPQICIYKLMGSCRYGSTCKNHHSDFPYQWQWKNREKWQDCEHNPNKQLEENFCKPNCTCATIPGQGTVNYKEMKLVSGGETKDLRRLETSTAMKGEARMFATKWLWYFGDDGRWTQYGYQGASGARTAIDSTEIEECYEKYQLGKHDATFKLQTERDTYLLNFEEFKQENIRTKFKRDIFRRPSLFVTEAVLDDMKKPPQVCTYNLSGKCEYGKKCRNHHSDFPYQWQWKKDDEWQDCPADLNIQLEENFCKPNITSATLTKQQGVDYKQLKLVSGGETTSLRRLETISAALTETKPFATKWLWYVENNNGWTEYGSQGPFGGKTTIGSTEIEKFYQDYLQGGESTLQFKVERDSYAMNMQALCQENMQNHNKRTIFRRPSLFVTQAVLEDMKKKKKSSPGDCEIPVTWTRATSTSSDYFYEVSKDSDEYKTVVTLFTKTLSSANINKIERIQNLELWEEYSRMKKKMKLKQGRDAVERLLFHGTGEDKLRPICQQGFDPRVAGLSTGTLYGCGSYFSSSAKYSNDYTGRSGKMIVASVLVGDFVHGNSSYKRPPPRDPSKPYENLYDSVVDNCQNPTIFVIFDFRQIYPNYLVHYSSN